MTCPTCGGLTLAVDCDGLEYCTDGRCPVPYAASRPTREVDAEWAVVMAAVRGGDRAEVERVSARYVTSRLGDEVLSRA